MINTCIHFRLCTSLMPAKGRQTRRGKEREGEERRSGKGGKRRKKHKETGRKPHREGRSKSLIATCYWCVAMCRKEASLALLIQGAGENTKSTLHYKPLLRKATHTASTYCTTQFMLDFLFNNIVLHWRHVHIKTRFVYISAHT